MDGTDLAHYTTQELVDELMNRETICGLVVMSDKEVRNNERGVHGDFSLHARNLDVGQVRQVLKGLLEKLPV